MVEDKYMSEETIFRLKVADSENHLGQIVFDLGKFANTYSEKQYLKARL